MIKNGNFASSLAFMYYMAYPPPPYRLEKFKKTIEKLTNGSDKRIKLDKALDVVDTVNSEPYDCGLCVLFVIQQRLHSSHPERVLLALELLDFCINNCNTSFRALINDGFMLSLYNLLKIDDYAQRTISGNFKHFLKKKVLTDPRANQVKRTLLFYINRWHKICNSNESIRMTYQKILNKNYKFPQSLDECEEQNCVSDELSDADYIIIQKIIQNLEDGIQVEQALQTYESIKPRLIQLKKNLTGVINSGKSRKLSSRDPEYIQLKIILELVATVEKLTAN